MLFEVNKYFWFLILSTKKNLNQIQTTKQAHHKFIATQNICRPKWGHENN